MRARDMIEEVDVRKSGVEQKGWVVKVPGVVPKLNSTPGKTEWAGGHCRPFREVFFGYG